MTEVGIIVFQDVEVLDFAGPFEVLSVAARHSAGHLAVETVGLSREIVCRGGLVVRPARLVSEDPCYDLLVIPGGPGASVQDHRHIIPFVQLTHRGDIPGGK
ncbi:MAG: DJ-1/PfpI family protein [Bacillota bacterium]